MAEWATLLLAVALLLAAPRQGRRALRTGSIVNAPQDVVMTVLA
jgi:hypothetical protein